MSGGIRTNVKGLLINANRNWRSTAPQAADCAVEKQKPEDVSFFSEDPSGQTDTQIDGHDVEENHNEREILSTVEEPDKPDDDDPLPSVEGLKIIDEAFVGQKITVSGYCINGTTSCHFQWVRHHPDGSVNNIDKAKHPEYLVTADDLGACLAVEVVPLDDAREREGKLQKVFANEHKKISCDPKMQSLIDKIFHMGHGSCIVFLPVYMGMWEPATLIIRRAGYSIKCTKLLEGSVVVEDHKFTPNTIVSIPYGSPAQFTVTDSDSGAADADHCFKIEDGLRDTVVLILRLFIRMREEEKSSKRNKQVLSFTMHVRQLFLFFCYLFRGLGISIRNLRRQQSDHTVGFV